MRPSYSRELSAIVVYYSPTQNQASPAAEVEHEHQHQPTKDAKTWGAGTLWQGSAKTPKKARRRTWGLPGLSCGAVRVSVCGWAELTRETLHGNLISGFVVAYVYS